MPEEPTAASQQPTQPAQPVQPQSYAKHAYVSAQPVVSDDEQPAVSIENDPAGSTVVGIRTIQPNATATDLIEKKRQRDEAAQVYGRAPTPEETAAAEANREIELNFHDPISVEEGAVATPIDEAEAELESLDRLHTEFDVSGESLD